MSEELLLDVEGLPITCPICREDFPVSCRYTVIRRGREVSHYHDDCMPDSLRENPERPRWTDGPLPI